MQVPLQYRADSRQGGPAVGQKDTGVERGSTKVERGPDNQKRPGIRWRPKEDYQEYIAKGI